MITRSDLISYNERLNNILAVLSDPPIVTIKSKENETITETIPSGNIIKIGKGYYPSDLYYEASEGIVPEGNIELQQQTGTNVTNYATASVKSGTAKAPTSISGTSATVSTSSNTVTLTKSISVTPNVVTQGWINSGTATTSTVTLSGSLPLGSIHSGTNNDSAYVTNNTYVPAEGYLYIDEGWHPKTKISLATLIPDDSVKEDAGTAQILKDYEAFDTDGRRIVGTIESQKFNTTYYTTTNTGYGSIVGYQYIDDNTHYIIKGSFNKTNFVTETENNSGISFSHNNGWFDDNETLYIKELTISSGKTLSKILNNGTISEISNTKNLNIKNSDNNIYVQENKFDIADKSDNSLIEPINNLLTQIESAINNLGIPSDYNITEMVAERADTINEIAEMVGEDA